MTRAPLARQLAHDRLLPAVGAAILLLFIALAALAPVLTPYSVTDMAEPLLPPTVGHPLGTDDMGHDLWTEWLHGARFSLALGFLSAAVVCALGLLLGVLSGYSVRARAAIMRLAAVFMCVPRFPLIILAASFVKPGFTTLLLFFSLLGWPSVTRIVCSAILAERDKEHVLAAQARGVPERRLLFRHLAPAALPVLAPRLVAEIQHVVVAESGLSYLGLGDAANRSWGMTLAHATGYPALLLTDTWQWWALPPGMAITLLCLSLALVGLRLDSAANPVLRARS